MIITSVLILESPVRILAKNGLSLRSLDTLETIFFYFWPMCETTVQCTSYFNAIEIACFLITEYICA